MIKSMEMVFHLLIIPQALHCLNLQGRGIMTPDSLYILMPTGMSLTKRKKNIEDMKKKVLFMFALLCTVAQGAWAETINLSQVTADVTAKDGDLAAQAQRSPFKARAR